MRYSISNGNTGMGGDLSLVSILEAIKFIIRSLPNQEKITFRLYRRKHG